MQLTELKKMPVEQLIELGEECGIENASRAKRQDIVFGILKSKAKSGEDIEGEGVLEILQDGFGFLRSPDSSYLAGPDDIYVSPSQIRRFGLRAGDTIKGKGVITKKYISGESHLIDCDIWLENPNGEKTTPGTATFELPIK